MFDDVIDEMLNQVYIHLSYLTKLQFFFPTKLEKLILDITLIFIIFSVSCLFSFQMKLRSTIGHRIPVLLIQLWYISNTYGRKGYFYRLYYAILYHLISCYFSENRRINYKFPDKNFNALMNKRSTLF